MSDKVFTYLCGGINGLSDAQCNDWRELAKSLLITDTLDPMRRDYRGREDDCVDEIVAGDEEDLQISKYILANASLPSWGTAMEIRAAAKEYGKPVVSIIGNVSRISPWLRKHSVRLFRTVEEGCAYINSLESR